MPSYTLMFTGFTAVTATKVVEAIDEKDAYDKGRDILEDFKIGKAELSWETEEDNEEVDNITVEVLT